jgi:hypothetical protein
MNTCLDHPNLRSSAPHPVATDNLFPFHNRGLRIPPLQETPARQHVSTGTPFSFRALPSRRPANRHKIDLTTYYPAAIPEAYSRWLKCEHFPHFMRAIRGSCLPETGRDPWRLRPILFT